jgi:hypothetical protein
MARVIKAPAPYQIEPGERTLFLAGSIEMGRAEPWQERLALTLHDLPLLLLNPRRDDWDSSWKQTIDDSQFREQVEWELDALECADQIAMYFASNTQSPITLLEFGLFARSGKLVVCCAGDFWRRGNIEVVCNRFQIPLIEHFDEMIQRIRQSSTPTESK